ncbi:MAG TPA: TonB-dependent receptor [Flavisolibacter sp.]|nr:TonB-dependent receptor [Flavisolibacter sp.]
MRYTCFLLFILLTSFFNTKTLAQAGSLTGKLIDEKGTAIGYANVALLKSTDTSFLAGALSDKNGVFTLQAPVAGSYALRFTAIGFATKKTEVFEVTASGFSKDFGTITLKQEAKTLQEVSVTALRPTITQLADRMVVGVEGTAMAAGSNAFTVLSKSPGVFIDAEGNIQLNGRSGVTVMLNGKLTYLSARDLRTLLEGMSAENIKNIEIITNPSAKYDAEGSSGILNINLKKYDRSGMNGSVYSGYTFNGKQHGYTAGGNINYNSGPWNTFLNLDFAHRVGGREATFTRVFYGQNQTTYFDQVATGNFMAEGPPTARVGIDYNININHSIGVMGYYNTNTAHADFLTNTFLGSAPKQPFQYIDADNYTTNTFRNLTTNLHYQGKLDTVGTTLSADLDYVNIKNRGYSNYYNYYTDLSNNVSTTDFLYTNLPNGYDIYSGKIDFTHPFSKEHKMEAGAKASRVISDNDSRFYFNNNGLVLDPLRTNHFNYNESIYAAYLNYNGTMSKRFTLQAGLRVEQTRSVGINYTTDSTTKRNYTDLFPSIFLQQKVSDNYGINYSYSRRLSRPNYGNLNPFKAYRDPYTWYEGNPYLRPQYTNVFSLAQTFKKVYILTLSYQRTKDVMAEIPILDVDNSTTIYTTGNVNDGHNASMTAVAPFKITKKWDTQNTVLLSYNKFSMQSNNGQLENDQLFYMFQSNHTIQLPKEIRMELNLLYRGPAASGLYHMAAMHRVDVAFKKSFLKKKLDLSVNANDLFKGYRFFWTTDINGNVNEFDQYFRFRNVGFTIRYNFSKGKKINVKQRNASVDEVNRI